MKPVSHSCFISSEFGEKIHPAVGFYRAVEIGHEIETHSFEARHPAQPPSSAGKAVEKDAFQTSRRPVFLPELFPKRLEFARVLIADGEVLLCHPVFP
jgi:hypothetical protein